MGSLATGDLSDYGHEDSELLHCRRRKIGNHFRCSLPGRTSSGLHVPDQGAQLLCTRHHSEPATCNWARNQRGLERYLNGPMRDRRGGCVLDWGSYLKLFGNVTGEIAIGEASTAYLISPEAPADIRAAIPNARIIIMLRSHVERAFSTYLMLCRNGRLRASFSDVIRSEGSGGLGRVEAHDPGNTQNCAWSRTISKDVSTRTISAWYFHEEFRPSARRDAEYL